MLCSTVDKSCGFLTLRCFFFAPLSSREGQPRRKGSLYTHHTPPTHPRSGPIYLLLQVPGYFIRPKLFRERALEALDFRVIGPRGSRRDGRAVGRCVCFLGSVFFLANLQCPHSPHSRFPLFFHVHSFLRAGNITHATVRGSGHMVPGNFFE